ncbi:hypothetical protein [Bacillus cereus]|uniref:hypothetical protein n=1 Tax=Bacillus cereus TaxID=1396 RepID=UPI001C8B913F|nr:hypothetical protein [Bacillus cereus]MBX9158262.1 hypothetical protein [Bacillus cereus]
MKPYMKKLTILGVLGAVSLSLAACDSDEEKAVKAQKKDFKVVYDYDYDSTRVVVEKEKTVEELAKDMMLQNVGLDTKEKRFAAVGVEKEQGIFIESAVRDGDAIPKVSAMTKEQIAELNQQDDGFAEKKKQTFEKLKEQRQAVLSKQYEDDKVETKKLEDDLKKKVAEQTKKIEKQKVDKEKQDAKEEVEKSKRATQEEEKPSGAK